MSIPRFITYWWITYVWWIFSTPHFLIGDMSSSYLNKLNNLVLRKWYTKNTYVCTVCKNRSWLIRLVAKYQLLWYLRTPIYENIFSLSEAKIHSTNQHLSHPIIRYQILSCNLDPSSLFFYTTLYISLNNTMTKYYGALVSILALGKFSYVLLGLDTANNCWACRQSAHDAQQTTITNSQISE